MMVVDQLADRPSVYVLAYLSACVSSCLSGQLAGYLAVWSGELLRKLVDSGSGRCTYSCKTFGFVSSGSLQTALQGVFRW
jgi:hypothetical protein